MCLPDRFRHSGKQASRRSLRLNDLLHKTQNKDESAPTLQSSLEDTVQNDSLRASESPALDNVRELLTSMDHIQNAVETGAPLPPNEVVEVPKDEILPDVDRSSSSEAEEVVGESLSLADCTENAVETDTPALSNDVLKISDAEALSGVEDPTPFENEDGVREPPSLASQTENAVEIDALPLSKKIAEISDEDLPEGEDQSSSEDIAELPGDGMSDKDPFDALSPSGEQSDTHHPTSTITASDNISWSEPEAGKLSHIPKVIASEDEEIVKASCLPSTDKLDSKGPGIQSSVPEQASDSLSMINANAEAPKDATQCRKAGSVSPTAATLAEISTPHLLHPKPLLQVDLPGQTPQIGTSLLRRESLRRKESPSKRKSLRKSKSPKKKDTLQRRDTLQEREILQKVIAEAETAPAPAPAPAPAQRTEDLKHQTSEAHVSEGYGSGIKAAISDGDDFNHNNELTIRVEEIDRSTKNGAEAPLSAIDETMIEKDLHRAQEAIEVYENPANSGPYEGRSVVATDDAQAKEATDNANECLARVELDEATQIVEATVGTDPSHMKIRSQARFSDDTNMLKDFLNRAQARKAAKTPTLSMDPPRPQISPRRSPRKALGSYVGNALSPQKLGYIATRPGTPPGKPRFDILDSDDADEITTEPASCRRSTRKHLPAPSKAPPGAPSFIPVRRADGTDPVILQKSQAQELAMVTRANTRRNKGQSKPPLLALQDLAAETAEARGMSKQRAENAKSVGWAENLASYQDVKDVVDASEEQRPKVKRVRGLGTSNGTPAPKRTTTVVNTSNGTPAPKRRGKVR